MDPQAVVEPLIPCDLDAERGVLGSILLDSEAFGRVVQILKAEDFHATAHRHVFASMMDLFDRDEPIDPVMLKSGLEKQGGGLEKRTPGTRMLCR